MVFKARLPAVPGAALIKALEAAGDQLYKERVSAETSDHTRYAMGRADALARVARKTTMIVALARKLLIAMWRMVTTGEIPDGVRLRSAVV